LLNLKKSFTVLSTKVLAGLLALSPINADACTRVVYLGPNADVITARSMDWNADIGTNLWIFPKGMERSGEAGRNSLRWTSKYGSVIASGFDVATTDGLNEAGLCANLLWLTESQYPAFDRSKPGLSVAAWAQYVLDNFATVQEAVNALRGEPFTIVTDTVPGETRLAMLHLSMSDATGDSAIVEYIGGKQVIHHDRKYQVMTNSPIFDEQLALNEQGRRKAWFESYLTTILQRDVRDLSNIDDLSAVPRLLSVVASRAGGLLNYADLSRTLGLPQTTLKRYFALLEMTFLVQLLRPWSGNVGQRSIRTPKVYLNDTGLLAHLSALSPERLETTKHETNCQRV
jgi:Linear amide C-N hydrolases, choloylglycine hydrolase family/Domain of unknown function (DUF4143)